MFRARNCAANARKRYPKMGKLKNLPNPGLQPPKKLKDRWGRVLDRDIGRCYVTHRYSNHWCKRYGAWGIQYSRLEELRDLGVEIIVIVVHQEKFDKGIEFHSYLRDWFEHGIRDSLNPRDGLQVFLKDFYLYGANQRDEFLRVKGAVA